MTNPTDDELRAIFAAIKTIAVVGMSADPGKPSHTIPEYMQSQGFHVIPVSPKGGEILGEKVVASLADIDVPVDVVDVFRHSEDTPPIARDAVAIGAKVLWLQSGIESEEAGRIATDGGLTVVMDACIGATHRRLNRAP